MSSVSLSFGLRSSVNSLTDIGKQIDTANTRLSTGKKVNTAIDNAGSYFAAVGFNKEASDQKALLDGENNGLNTISKANNAITAITSLVQSIQSLARSARNLASDDATRDTIYGKQIQSLVNQITNLTADAGFNGKNLLRGATQANGDTLSVVTNTATLAANQTKVDLVFADINVGGFAAGATTYANAQSGLALTSNAAADFFNFTATQATSLKTTVAAATNGVFSAKTTGATALEKTTADGNLDALIAQSGVALNTLTSVGSAISTQATVLQVRQTFGTATARINSSAADNLTLADLNEEGAALTSLQTRQSFAVTSLQLAGQADKAILRLFG